VTFAIALLLVVAWALSGPVFGFSDTWQLVINTGTTVLTFLMVFMIQNSLNRDSAALHVKLDELLRVTEEARTSLVGAESSSERELERLRAEEEREAATEGREGARSARGD
jgi:low affinity Fe/Cu permease